MAKINPVKVKQDADKLEKAGKLPEAIALFKQVIEDNPRDWNIINKVGDLYAKLNKFKDAADYYAKVADFYAKDGFHLKAIAIWKKINKLDATSLDPYLNLAELYAKQGLMMEAKSQYQYVVDEYIKRSKMREAGDVLKKMADIDPSDLKIRSKLADLYTREGNSAKAVEEHVAIAEELTKKGHLAEALQVLEKGLKIDSKSGRLRLELGRIHLVQKNYDKAVHFLEEASHGMPNDADILGRLGEAYLGSKRIAEAEGLFKRLLEINPNDEDVRVQMARVSLQQGQYDRAYAEMEPLVEKLLQRRDDDRAASLLQQIVQKSPNHVKTLNRLVEVYQQFSKESSLLATYSQLTEAYIQQGQLGEAASVLEVLVQREPANAQHKTKLQFVKGKLGGAAAPAPAAAPASSGPELIEEEFDLSAADEAPAPAPAPPPAPARASAPARAAAPAAASPARPVIQVTGPLSDQDREFIDEHLAEGKVFRKYGLIDKAADQFEAVVARFADNLESRQELREVYAEKGLPAKAAEQCLALAEIFRLKGDAASAKKYEDEAEQHVPGSAGPAKSAAPAARPAAAPAPAPARAAAPRAPAPVVQEEEFSLGDEEEIPLGGEEDISIAVDEPEAAPAAAEEESLDLDQELATGQDLPSPFIDEEPAAAPAAEEDVSIGFDEATLDAPIASEAPAEEVGFGVEEEFPLDEPAPAPPPPPPPPPRAARPAPPAAKPAPPPPPAKPAPAAKAPAPAKPAPPPPAPKPAPAAKAPAPKPAPPPPAARPAAPPAELRAAPLATKASGGRAASPSISSASSKRSSPTSRSASWTTPRKRCARAACASRTTPCCCRRSRSSAWKRARRSRRPKRRPKTTWLPSSTSGRRHRPPTIPSATSPTMSRPSPSLPLRTTSSAASKIPRPARTPTRPRRAKTCCRPARSPWAKAGWTWALSSVSSSALSPRSRSPPRRAPPPSSATPGSPTSSRSSRRASTSSSARKTTTPATTSASRTRRWGSSTRPSPSSSSRPRTKRGCSSARACWASASSRRACRSWP